MKYIKLAWAAIVRGTLKLFTAFISAFIFMGVFGLAILAIIWPPAILVLAVKVILVMVAFSYVGRIARGE
jgi:hypothetical protein